ncbi:hypothetical protein NC653_026719 [Populus alba x Populus x berolinensis]|uniref:Uncharacterized protein n=1 Tax=Populus alba x Populus x berolinensis TaxID=444605 RepID=A0AAD6M4Q7_9ROSI|nr:hypothetical protein NC653_026719 [Populus alba x Populus x berolinensis]
MSWWNRRDDLRGIMTKMTSNPRHKNMNFKDIDNSMCEKRKKCKWNASDGRDEGILRCIEHRAQNQRGRRNIALVGFKPSQQTLLVMSDVHSGVTEYKFFVGLRPKSSPSCENEDQKDKFRQLVRTVMLQISSLLAINIRNQDSNSFHHTTPQGSVIFHTRQWFDVRMLGFPIDRADQSLSGNLLLYISFDGWIFTSQSLPAIPLFDSELTAKCTNHLISIFHQHPSIWIISSFFTHSMANIL